MFAILAVIFLLVWAAGLIFHFLGGVIWIALVLAVISGIVHFFKGKKPAA